jgi:hypothetical protein
MQISSLNGLNPLNSMESNKANSFFVKNAFLNSGEPYLARLAWIILY